MFSEALAQLRLLSTGLNIFQYPIAICTSLVLFKLVSFSVSGIANAVPGTVYQFCPVITICIIINTFTIVVLLLVS